MLISSIFQTKLKFKYTSLNSIKANKMFVSRIKWLFFILNIIQIDLLK